MLPASFAKPLIRYAILLALLSPKLEYDLLSLTTCIVWRKLINTPEPYLSHEDVEPYLQSHAEG